MSLAEAQSAMMAQVTAPGIAPPNGWSARQQAGLDIYRNAYRARLVDTLAEIYPRTRDWVGGEAFAQAAAHHLITNPPSGWTIDHAGDGFHVTLAELFPNDREVDELAWLEAAMHAVFVAEDAVPLDAARFTQATAAFAPQDWERMRLSFVPGFSVRAVAHDCGAIWRSLTHGEPVPENYAFDRTCGLVVWREGLEPVFRLVDIGELLCLDAMIGGTSYAATCAMLAESLGEDDVVARAGSMLGSWLSQGWIAGVSA